MNKMTDILALAMKKAGASPAAIETVLHDLQQCASSPEFFDEWNARGEDALGKKLIERLQQEDSSAFAKALLSDFLLICMKAGNISKKELLLMLGMGKN